MKIGVDYYPEHQDRSLWTSDAEMHWHGLIDHSYF